MDSKFVNVVEGSIQVPLPDDPVARAKVFGEVAAAWSTMLSTISHLMPVGRGGTLSGGMQPAPRMPMQYGANPVVEAVKQEAPKATKRKAKATKRKARK